MAIHRPIATAAILLVGLATSVGCANNGKADDRAVVSPDGNVRFVLTETQPKLAYAVTLNNKPVLDRSPIVVTIDGEDVTDGATVAGASERYDVNETYATRGAHSQAVDRCNGARFSFRHAPTNTQYTLDVRAYDDGVAYRIVAPASSNDQKRTPDESSTFTIPAGSTVWYHGLRGHYEQEYKKYDIGEVKAKDWAGPPLTYQLPDGAGYASITEANLVNYSGMALEADGQRGFVVGLAHRQPVSYPYELRYTKEDIERLSHPAVITGAITTPWRVVLVGENLNTLVNSDIITNLCPPPDPKHFPQGLATEWVKPGRAVWRYLDNGPSTAPTQEDPSIAVTMGTQPSTRPARQRTADGAASRPTTRGASSRPAVRIAEINERWTAPAAQLGFEHNILEGFWRRWSEDQIRAVVDFGKQRGVGIWLWKHTKDLRDANERREFFELCSRTGVAGAKIDFFDHEHKEVIDQYHAIFHDAAEHKVLLNFHGANKPTGESRTWPNELTREAIRGMEASRMKERAAHETTVPFTRFLAGHAEYTPMHFGERRGDTTWAHQVALPIIFTTPLLTYAASPQNILKSEAVDVIKSIPSTWDETRVLPPSEIGEIAVFARRKGGTWFLAIANGPAEKPVKVPLTFLESGAYRATVVKDTESDRAAMDVADVNMTRNDLIELKLVAGGGFVARFVK